MSTITALLHPLQTLPNSDAEAGNLWIAVAGRRSWVFDPNSPFSPFEPAAAYNTNNKSLSEAHLSELLMTSESVVVQWDADNHDIVADDLTVCAPGTTEELVSFSFYQNYDSENFLHATIDSDMLKTFNGRETIRRYFQFAYQMVTTLENEDAKYDEEESFDCTCDNNDNIVEGVTIREWE